MSETSAGESKRIEIYTRLRQYGVYIEHKFRAARPYDITPEHIQGILDDVTVLVYHYPEGQSVTVQALRNLCATAISFYPDPQTRPSFFERVETIGTLLIQL